MIGSCLGIILFFLPFLISWLRCRYLKKQTSKEAFGNCVAGGMMGLVYCTAAVIIVVQMFHIIFLI